MGSRAMQASLTGSSQNPVHVYKTSLEILTTWGIAGVGDEGEKHLKENTYLLPVAMDPSGMVTFFVLKVLPNKDKKD